MNTVDESSRTKSRNRKIAATIVLTFIVIGVAIVSVREITMSNNGSPASSSNSSSFPVSKQFSLNNQQDAQNSAYPSAAVSWNIYFPSGSYQILIHTTGTISVTVCSSVTCLAGSGMAFTSSENPPNVETFTVNSVSAGNYAVTIELCGVMQPLSSAPYCGWYGQCTQYITTNCYTSSSEASGSIQISKL